MGCMSGPDSTPEGPSEVRQPLSAPATSGLRASVRRTSTTVEIEVTSDTPFQNGALPPVLVIGDQAFGLSRTPPDGREDTLIFLLTPAELDAVADGEVRVGYLAPGARLSLPPQRSAGGGALSAQTSPQIRPDQVARQRRVGVLRKRTLEVVP
jgi:hypothetical protein